MKDSSLGQILLAVVGTLLIVSPYIAAAVHNGTLESWPGQTFGDEFENGLSWTATRVTSGLAVTPTLETYAVQSPTHAVLFQTNATLNAATCMLSETIGSTFNIYVRCYVYVASPDLTTLGSNDRFYFFQLRDVNNTGIVYVGLRRSGVAPLRWCVVRATNGTGASELYGTTTVTSVPMWTELELYWNNPGGLSSGYVTLWINGVQELYEQRQYTNVPSVTSVSLGIYKIGVTNSTTDPTTQYPINVYADDFVAAGFFIGPYSPPGVITITGPTTLTLPTVTSVIYQTATITQQTAVTRTTSVTMQYTTIASTATTITNYTQYPPPWILFQGFGAAAVIGAICWNIQSTNVRIGNSRKQKR